MTILRTDDHFSFFDGSQHQATMEKTVNTLSYLFIIDGFLEIMMAEK